MLKYAQTTQARHPTLGTVHHVMKNNRGCPQFPTFDVLSTYSFVNVLLRSSGKGGMSTSEQERTDSIRMDGCA
jgi:hypothetical protein